MQNNGHTIKSLKMINRVTINNNNDFANTNLRHKYLDCRDLVDFFLWIFKIAHTKQKTNPKHQTNTQNYVLDRLQMLKIFCRSIDSCQVEGMRGLARRKLLLVVRLDNTGCAWKYEIN